MEENNNNNQTVPGVTPVTQVPETSVTPVTPEPSHMEVHPVPSLVIEDNAQAETPVEPVASTPVDTPVAPVTQVPEMPTEPVTSVPETPVITDKPVEPTAAPIQTTSMSTEKPVVPNETEKEVEKMKVGKKNYNVIALIILVVCLVVAVVYFLSKGNDTPTPSPNLPSNPANEEELKSLPLNQANLNGVTFTFPEKKSTFNNVGWTWEASYAQKDVQPGIGTYGGRVGSAPGGASVLVINKGTTPAHVEDCIIYSATFYNPKDGSEKVTFVGGLVYTSNPDAVKSRMKELGYKKVNSVPNQNTLSLKYFLNDDNTNTNDFIEFYFVDNIMESVTISTAV